MSITFIVHGERTAAVADFMRNRLDTILNAAAVDINPPLRADLIGINAVESRDLYPQDPDNVELAEFLKSCGESCQACEYFHTLFSFIAPVGSMDAYHALKRLLDLHYLDECWSTTIPGEYPAVAL